MTIESAERPRRLHWSLVRRVEVIRIVFAVVWAIDAYYKWQPDFVKSYASTVAEGGQGQPVWIHWWFRFWSHAVRHSPHIWAYGTAALETFIALALLVGFARRTLYIV